MNAFFCPPLFCPPRDVLIVLIAPLFQPLVSVVGKVSLFSSFFGRLRRLREGAVFASPSSPSYGRFGVSGSTYFRNNEWNWWDLTQSLILWEVSERLWSDRRIAGAYQNLPLSYCGNLDPSSLGSDPPYCSFLYSHTSITLKWVEELGAQRCTSIIPGTLVWVARFTCRGQ